MRSSRPRVSFHWLTWVPLAHEGDYDCHSILSLTSWDIMGRLGNPWTKKSGNYVSEDHGVPREEAKCWWVKNSSICFLLTSCSKDSNYFQFFQLLVLKLDSMPRVYFVGPVEIAVISIYKSKSSLARLFICCFSWVPISNPSLGLHAPTRILSLHSKSLSFLRASLHSMCWRKTCPFDGFHAFVVCIIDFTYLQKILTTSKEAREGNAALL